MFVRGGLRLQSRRTNAIADHGVVSCLALQRQAIRGSSPRRLRHPQFQPTPRQDQALSFKQAILDEASQYNETWEDRFNAVQGEVEAFAELAALSPDDVPADLLAEMKQRATAEHDWYSAQLKEVQQWLIPLTQVRLYIVAMPV
jgi:hypothetical protein